METVVATHLRVCPIRSRFIFFLFFKKERNVLACEVGGEL